MKFKRGGRRPPRWFLFGLFVLGYFDLYALLGGADDLLEVRDLGGGLVQAGAQLRESMTLSNARTYISPGAVLSAVSK